MPKDDGTGTLLRLDGDSDGITEHLGGSPPRLWLANIICGRKDVAWKRCHLAAMLTTTTTSMTVRMTMGGSK
jgi:hypothetical protein